MSSHESPRQETQNALAAPAGGIRETTPGGRVFPGRLELVSDPPERLYYLGELAETELSVAIVGARKAGAAMCELVSSLACELARAGVVVVSGGAVGVDAAAHRGALSGDGPTVAVLGGGLDRIYPERNLPLFNEILQRRGALVTPFEADAAPLAGRFVRRNRIIAGMADAVLVAQADVGSGSLHTAAAAREYGRVVAAVPGSPGCEALIAQGAAVVERAGDLFAALDGRARKPAITLPTRGSAEARVLDILDDSSPLDEDTIADRTGLEIWGVTRALTGLELDGLALLLPGRNYLRSALARELKSN